jgi:hypothetical protein
MKHMLCGIDPILLSRQQAARQQAVKATSTSGPPTSGPPTSGEKQKTHQQTSYVTTQIGTCITLHLKETIQTQMGPKGIGVQPICVLDFVFTIDMHVRSHNQCKLFVWTRKVLSDMISRLPQTIQE